MHPYSARTERYAGPVYCTFYRDEPEPDHHPCVCYANPDMPRVDLASRLVKRFTFGSPGGGGSYTSSAAARSLIARKATAIHRFWTKPTNALTPRLERTSYRDIAAAGAVVPSPAVMRSRNCLPQQQQRRHRQQQQSFRPLAMTTIVVIVTAMLMMGGGVVVAIEPRGLGCLPRSRPRTSLLPPPLAAADEAACLDNACMHKTRWTENKGG